MQRHELLPAGPGWVLTPAEQRLVECAANGIWWIPEVPEEKKNWDKDPAKSASWPEECELRFEVILCLITGTPWSKDGRPWPLDPRGVLIANAKIDGDVTLRGCELLAEISFYGCAIIGQVDLRGARTRSIGFTASKVNSFLAVNAIIDGDLWLDDKFQSEDFVELSNAEITGHLKCTNSTLGSARVPNDEDPNNAVLHCFALQVGTSVYLDGDFHACGCVNFRNARIHGDFACAGHVENKSKDKKTGVIAIDCDAIDVGGAVYLNNGLRVDGAARFVQATVGAHFDGRGATFTCGKDCIALTCYGISIRGEVLLSDGFSSVGTVYFTNGMIGRDLKCSGASFTHADDDIFKQALVCAFADIQGSVQFMRDAKDRGFCAHGNVTFVGAEIGGYLVLVDASLANPELEALSCYGLRVGADVEVTGTNRFDGDVDFAFATVDGKFLMTVATEDQVDRAGKVISGVSGKLALSWARIGGVFMCTGKFVNAKGPSLEGFGVSVGADVFLARSFTAKGAVELSSAIVGRDLICEGGSFDNPGGTALSINSARIGMGLILSGVKSLAGTLSLEQAEARFIQDDGSAWPLAGSGDIILDGFTYQRFSGPTTDVGWKTRLEWLERQPKDHLTKHFKSQPWVQLIDVLHAMGHEEDARIIGTKRAQRVAHNIPWWRGWSRLWSSFLGITVGYGYRPWRAAQLSALFIAIGSVVFSYAYSDGYMSSRDGSVIAYMTEHNTPEVPSNLPQIQRDHLCVRCLLAHRRAWSGQSLGAFISDALSARSDAQPNQARTRSSLRGFAGQET